MRNETVPLDHGIILGLVNPPSRVLDLACGNGRPLELLEQQKRCSAQGIEIDEKAIYECVERGLNVLHGDIDSGLAEYADKSFDYVILNQSLQQVKHFQSVLSDALRVGKNVIVGFPNFAFYAARFQLFFQGRSPVTGCLPYNWYESPNIHFLSITDFIAYCRKNKITIAASAFIGKHKPVKLLPNLRAETGIFHITT